MVSSNQCPSSSVQPSLIQWMKVRLFLSCLNMPHSPMTKQSTPRTNWNTSVARCLSQHNVMVGIKFSTLWNPMLFPLMSTMVSSTLTCPFLTRTTSPITHTHSSPLTLNGTLSSLTMNNFLTRTHVTLCFTNFMTNVTSRSMISANRCSMHMNTYGMIVMMITPPTNLLCMTILWTSLPSNPKILNDASLISKPSVPTLAGSLLTASSTPLTI